MHLLCLDTIEAHVTMIWVHKLSGTNDVQELVRYAVVSHQQQPFDDTADGVERYDVGVY